MIGENLEQLIEHKLGPRSLGKAADMMGISRPYMSDICNGHRALTPAVAVKLSKLFGEGVGRSLWIKQAELEYEAAQRKGKKA